MTQKESPNIYYKYIDYNETVSCFKLDKIKERKKLHQINCDYGYLNKSLIVYFKDRY